jgi:hypothetical protein
MKEIFIFGGTPKGLLKVNGNFTAEYPRKRNASFKGLNYDLVATVKK